MSKNKHFILKSLIFLNFLIFLPISCFSQEYETLPIGDGSIYLCILDSEYGNVIGRIFDGELYQVSYAKNRKRLRRRKKRLQRRIRRAQSRGNQNLVNSLQGKLGIINLTLNDIIECWADSGKYIPGNGGTPPISDPTNPPSNSDLACQVAGDTGVNSRIINGDICRIGNSPVVELELLRNGSVESGCTGTVVAKRVVITAAHCLEGMTSVRAITGSGSFNSSSIHYDPRFDSTQNLEEYDVAVVLFNRDLPTRISGILTTNNLVINETSVIAGYGQDENNNSGSFRAATALISSAPRNSIEIRYSGNNENGNTCFGDSGGPIFVKRGNDWLLAGATSWGINDNCGPGDRSYFMNITNPEVKTYINSIVPGLIN